MKESQVMLSNGQRVISCYSITCGLDSLDRPAAYTLKGSVMQNENFKDIIQHSTSRADYGYKTGFISPLLLGLSYPNRK